MLRIQLTDEAMQRNKLTTLGQTTRWPNKLFGLDGIYVVSADLNISFSELGLLFQKHLSEYNPTATDDTK
ncbi:hypothetical protein GCM10007385_39600 [Tateyamaria omphalii]|nr:hypothetical protein GCM10007385_39600 [Tateyamaria omphalii]